MTAHTSFDERVMPPEEIRMVQLERLQALLNRAARNVSYYHDLFGSTGFTPEELNSLDDLKNLPLTERETLLERQPYGMLAVAPRDVVRLHTALGPNGVPFVVANTAGDIRHWTQLTSRAFRRARVTQDDAVQICLDYGKSVGAFGMHYGAEAVGATVIPRSNLILSDQLRVMRDYRATCLVCTPSYAHELGHYIEEEKFDARTLFLRSVILVDEPWTAELKQEIADRLFAKVFVAYGLDEVCNPGVAFGNGDTEMLSINQDHFIAEIVDPANGKPLDDGKEGELVLTTLMKEGLPLIRYRTGELGSLKYAQNENGVRELRLTLTGKRKDDLLFVNGSKFYPQQICELLESVMEVKPQFNIVLTPGEKNTRTEVRLAIFDKVFEKEMVSVNDLKERLESELFLKFGITFHVRWLERGSLADLPIVQDLR